MYCWTDDITCNKIVRKGMVPHFPQTINSNMNTESQIRGSVLMSPPTHSSRMYPGVGPRGARAAGSSGLGVVCSAWPQSCAYAFEPETKPVAAFHLHSCPPPHSRGSQAHALPGRSGALTGTSLPPPPSGYRRRLLPAVKRPLAIVSPLGDPPLPSPGDTDVAGASAGGHCLGWT